MRSPSSARGTASWPSTPSARTGAPAWPSARSASGVVHCPLHAWRFRLEDGSCPEFPEVAVDDLPRIVEGEEVFLEL